MRCCSITKKLVFAAVAVALVVGIYHFGSYIKSSIQHAERNLPPEVRLKMVKEDIAKLNQDIDKNWGPIAKLEGEIKDTRQSLNNEQAWLESKKTDMLNAAGDLEAKVEKVSYNGKQLKANEARKALASDAELYKTRKQHAESLTRVLASQEKALQAFTARQNEMKNAKAELSARVAQIEADLQNLELAKTKTYMPNGDYSRLDRIKETLNDLEKDTRDRLREVELRDEFNKANSDTAPTEPTKDSSANDEVIKRVRAVTGGESKTESAGD
ncbi:MAG TPA: hypothetical protein VKS79_08600 [Gemmataceae bacterium]|nr:hypothetical protein [Gemmataceae bacterium]